MLEGHWLFVGIKKLQGMSLKCFKSHRSSKRVFKWFDVIFWNVNWFSERWGYSWICVAYGKLSNFFRRLLSVLKLLGNSRYTYLATTPSFEKLLTMFFKIWNRSNLVIWTSKRSNFLYCTYENCGIQLENLLNIQIRVR